MLAATRQLSSTLNQATFWSRGKKKRKFASGSFSISPFIHLTFLATAATGERFARDLPTRLVGFGWQTMKKAAQFPFWKAKFECNKCSSLQNRVTAYDLMWWFLGDTQCILVGFFGRLLFARVGSFHLARTRCLLPSSSTNRHTNNSTCNGFRWFEHLLTLPTICTGNWASGLKCCRSFCCCCCCC